MRSSGPAIAKLEDSLASREQEGLGESHCDSMSNTPTQ